MGLACPVGIDEDAGTDEIPAFLFNERHINEHFVLPQRYLLEEIVHPTVSQVLKTRKSSGVIDQ